MKKLFLMILVFAAFGAYAQIKPYGFAGDDVEVFFDPNGSYPRTEVGVERIAVDAASDEPHPQYFWCCTSKPSDEAFCFIMDEHDPITEIMLSKPGLYILEVTRVSEYGIQRESVTVTVTNDIKLISAKPKSNCYANGTEMQVSDFEFVTSPQIPADSYEDKIRLLPRTATLNVGNKLEDMFKYQEVFFEVGNDDNEGIQRWKKDPVPAKVMATSDFKFHVDLKGDWWSHFDCGLFGEEAVEKVETAKSILELIDRLQKIPAYIRHQLPESIDNPKPHKGQPAPSSPYSVSFTGDLDNLTCYLNDECCDDNKTVRIGVSGTVNFGAAVSIEVPVPYLYVPGAGGLTIIGGAELNTTAGLDISIPIGCSGTKVVVPLQVGVGASLTASVNLISPSVASINVGLKGEATVDVEWNSDSGWGDYTTDSNLHLLIYVMGAGIKIANVDVPLLPPDEPEVTVFEMPEDIDDFDPDNPDGDDDDGDDDGDKGSGK